MMGSDLTGQNAEGVKKTMLNDPVSELIKFSTLFNTFLLPDESSFSRRKFALSAHLQLVEPETRTDINHIYIYDS